MRYHFFTLSLVPLVTGQNLLSVLSGQAQLTNFTAYISKYPDLLATLNTGNRTILAPSDAAFSVFSNANRGNNATDSNREWLEATLSYHVLSGLYPEVILDGSSKFIPTLLTNSKYSNVTGGQRVEAGSVNGSVAFYSAVKAVSRIIEPDIIFSYGLIHIVDAVLNVPVNILETIPKAGWQYFIPLLTYPGFLSTAFASVIANLSSLNDTTYLIINSAQAVADVQRIPYNTYTNASLVSLLEYYCLDSIVAYSSLLKDGSTFQTIQGNNVTITVENGSTYVNDAKIIDRDFLTSNGVIHVIGGCVNYSLHKLDYSFHSISCGFKDPPNNMRIGLFTITKPRRDLRSRVRLRILPVLLA
ncbi:FAS1 domain-containing protein [Cryomyces antarcticus]